jgi:hypothetical protein
MTEAAAHGSWRSRIAPDLLVDAARRVRTRWGCGAGLIDDDESG